jgi:hypothetical protein
MKIIPGGRTGAYRWLKEVTGLSTKDAHIGRFDKKQCELVIEYAKLKLRGVD